LELEVWGTPALRNALALADLPDLTSVISHGSISRAEIDELRKRRPSLTLD
ncbi:MAG: hypothetical protein H0U13_15720, partial [Gemmatimonadaceae bacterium]|nr:hypothetical protein [Gemmatimonadaceae bacterium]